MNDFNSRKPSRNELIDESLDAANEIQLTFIDAKGIVCPHGGDEQHENHQDTVEVGEMGEGVVGSNAVKRDAFVGQEAPGGEIVRGVNDFLATVDAMVLDLGDGFGFKFHRSLSPGTRTTFGIGAAAVTTIVILALNIAAIYFVFTLILDAGGTVYKTYNNMGVEAILATVGVIAGLLVAKVVGGYLADDPNKPTNDNNKK